MDSNHPFPPPGPSSARSDTSQDSYPEPAFDPEDEPSLAALLAETNTGIKPEPAGVPRPVTSGWLVGIIFGIIIGLWALPPVRYTLGAQLSFAFAEDSMPWIKPLDAHRPRREVALLDTATAAASGDYLVRVGRATALVDTDSPHATAAHPAALDDRDHTLFRLTLVTRDFPGYHGACAHLARYMMMNRVRLIRAELATPTRRTRSVSEQAAGLQQTARTIPAMHSDVRLMEWALRRGEQLEPDNAFWPAMLATTYFAAERDREALHELHRVNRASRWDAYLYEEILGQWRLYSLAYGDHGAVQKIGPLSLLAFPHLHEIRRMALLARWYAEQAARQGDLRQAIRIRHSIARLGRTMRETASWAYEALYGTELTLIAYSDGDSGHIESIIQTPAQWRPQATRFLALLTRAKLHSEINWVTQEVEACCTLRKAVGLARSDTSYPGIPPGIPLAPLFGNWMAGVSLIQQCAALLIATLLAIGWQRYVRLTPRSIYRMLLPLLTIATLLTGGLLFLGVPSEPLAIAFLILTTLTLLLLLESLFLRRKGKGEENPQIDTDFRRQGSLDHIRVSDHQPPESLWSSGVTFRMVGILLLPGLAALALLRPRLSEMHPVAILLTRWFGSAPTPNSGEMVLVALLTGALPLAAILAAGIWGLSRRVSPVASAMLGLRRIALPTITCLVVVYLVLLQRTLLLDTRSSRAINEAAKNDRQWVLTHVNEDPE